MSRDDDGETVDPGLLQMYQREVHNQCVHVVTGSRALDDVLTDRAGDPWYHVQAIVQAAATASRLLWGQDQKADADRRPLRESLEVTESSPFHHTKRMVRNGFEHVDDRIDKWWKQSPSRSHFDSHVGPFDAHTRVVMGITDIKDVFRWLDPRTREVIFQGDRLDLVSLAAEARSVRFRARQALIAAHEALFPPGFLEIHRQFVAWVEANPDDAWAWLDEASSQDQ